MAQEDVVNVKISCLNLPSECSQGVRIVVGALLENGNKFTEIGQTESIFGHVNPSFQRMIPVISRLDLNQVLKFTLYIINESEEFIEKCSETEINLLTLLISASQMTFSLNFLPTCSAFQHSQFATPLLVAFASPSESSSRGTVLQFIGDSLSFDGIHHSTAYFIIELLPNVTEKLPILLYRSEMVHHTDHPKWREFTIPTSFFPCTVDWQLQISCYNFNNNAEDFLLGRFTTTFYQLLNTSGSTKFMLGKDLKKKKVSSMELLLVRSREDIPSFYNMLKSGIQMHFTVAIDFTANNGGPNTPNSLHYIHPYNSNAYMNALATISPALFKFDKLERLSLLGFGAKVPPSFELSQNFALNGNVNNPHVKGLKEIMHFYRNNAITLLPYAPTEYSGVIHHIIKLAKASLRTSAGYYFTLVILTNGAIRDTRDTIDTIVQASQLPISIVFVAIGNSSHSIGLSGDALKLTQLLSPTLKSSRNEGLNRETVSFVVNNQGHHPYSLTDTSLSILTQRILINLPRQVTLWALKNQGM